MFFAVVVWGIREHQLRPDEIPSNGLALGIVAVMVVAVFTVIPWLIFKMIGQAVFDFRRWRSKPVSGKPVVPEFLDNGVPRRRVGFDRIPRIGK